MGPAWGDVNLRELAGSIESNEPRLLAYNTRGAAYAKVGRYGDAIAEWTCAHVTAPATVAMISPAIDPQRGTVDLRLAVEPVPAFLRQDMTVSVNIETGRRDSAVVVPNDALSTTDGASAEAWVINDGNVERRTLQLGLRGLTLTEVVEGLQPGDIVLADAAALVTDGDNVRVELAPLPATEAEAANASATGNELPVQLD